MRFMRLIDTTEYGAILKQIRRSLDECRIVHVDFQVLMLALVIAIEWSFVQKQTNDKKNANSSISHTSERKPDASANENINNNKKYSQRFDQHHLEHMLRGRIGLTQRNIDGFVQTEGHLIGKAIGIGGAIFTTMIWYVQIWKNTVDMHTAFDAILIGAKDADDGNLSTNKTTNKRQ